LGRQARSGQRDRYQRVFNSHDAKAGIERAPTIATGRGVS